MMTKRPREHMKSLSFTCPPSLREATIERADEEGLTLSSFIRNALKSALNNQSSNSDARNAEHRADSTQRAY